MRKLYHGLARHPEALVAFASGLLVAFVSVALVGSASWEGSVRARFLVNLFKFGVGVYCVGVALYLYYGPRVHQFGYFKRVTPSRPPAVEVPIIFASLGIAACLSGMAIVQPGYVTVLFLRVVAYAILGAIATGYFVLVLERLANLNGDDPPPR